MNVSGVLNKTVEYGLKKPLNMLANSKASTYVCKNFEGNNLKVIGGIAMFSIILKDGLGCYMYVKQSLNNKKIPEDKRKFVAALDLTNGGLMILMQILAYKTISNEKVQAKIFDKVFKKFFDKPARSAYLEIMKKTKGLENLSAKSFNPAFEKLTKDAKKTFGLLTSLVAATIIAKRVFVPFIATPLADKAKAWMCRNDKPAAQEPSEAPKAKEVESIANGQKSTNLLKNFSA